MSEPRTTTVPDAKRLAPHPPLTSYYNAEPNRSAYVVALFDRSAQHYNTIERGFLNTGLWYRRYLLRREGLRPGMTVLDVATGTGAVARGAVGIGAGPTAVRRRPRPPHHRAAGEGRRHAGDAGESRHREGQAIRARQ